MFTIRLFAPKIIALTLLILSLISTARIQAATPNRDRSLWKVVAPQGSGFYVRMPGQPVKKINGNSTQYSYVERLPGATCFYGIVHEDYVSIPAAVEETLRGQCNDFAKGFSGQVVRWTAATKNGLPGIAARVENKDSTAVVAAWLVDRRVYVIAFATQKTQILPDEARQFIDSLAFTRYGAR